MDAFSSQAQLPQDYGLGFDERCVEYPWMISRLPFVERVLDAGGVFDNYRINDFFASHRGNTRQSRDYWMCDHVSVWMLMFSLYFDVQATLLYGQHRAIGDLRAIPAADKSFDCIVCMSTLEHIGFDQMLYHGNSERAPDTWKAAVVEMRRVLSPGGSCLVTVPYGMREDHGWFRQFDAVDIEDLKDVFHPLAAVEEDYFGYGDDGWQITGPGALRFKRYRDVHEVGVGESDVAAARGVACLRFA